jgi:predicted nucleic acid-binding Zn ribbon protein
MKIDLSKPFTIGQMLNWQIHWIYCRLYDLAGELHEDKLSIDDAIKRLEQLGERFERVLSEAIIMDGNDGYRNDFREAVSRLEAYSRTVDTFEQLKENFRRKLAKQQAEQVDKLEQSFNLLRL